MIRLAVIISCMAAFGLAAGSARAQEGKQVGGNAAEKPPQPPMNLRIITAGPTPGTLPLDAGGAMQISEGDRCPVCAMRPVRSPKFASAISLKNGATYYFCGTGCMIRSWMHPETFLGVPKTALDRPVIQEYFTGETMDARKVVWVAGSDVIGPMGSAMVPISQESLPAFQKRHGGNHVFMLDEVNDAKWTEITGKNAAGK